jgi:flagellar hook assembly protein FlgD
VTLAFTLPGADRAAVRVYNIAGQLVETVADDTYAAGEHRLTWQPVGLAGGTYLVSVETPAGHRTAKVLYVK